MNDVVQRMIVIGAERRVLVGTAAGRVFECAADRLADRRDFVGLEGSSIQALSTSIDGHLLMASDATGNALVWERNSGEIIDALRATHPIVQGAVVGPHDYLTLDNRRHGLIWKLGDAAELVSAPMTERPEVPCGFDRFGISDDGKRIVLLSGFQWMVWNREQGVVTERHEPVDGMQLIYMSGDIGLSKNGRFYYVYWDDYSVIDTVDGRELWTHPISIHLQASALSDDGQLLVVGSRDGGQVVVIGPDGKAVVDRRPAVGAVMQVSISTNGSLVTFVDMEGGGGCIQVPSGEVVLDRDTMKEAVES